MTNIGEEKNSAQAAKKTYEKPRLVEYGDVREFTKGPGGSKKDSKSGGVQGA